MTCTLDELYAAFVGIIAGLREDTTACLCNTYFSALITPLQDKIEDYNFCMPALHGLTTKTIQLGLLCIVGSTAFKSFKSLNDEENSHTHSYLEMGTIDDPSTFMDPSLINNPINRMTHMGASTITLHLLQRTHFVVTVITRQGITQINFLLMWG